MCVVRNFVVVFCVVWQGQKSVRMVSVCEMCGTAWHKMCKSKNDRRVCERTKETDGRNGRDSSVDDRIEIGTCQPALRRHQQQRIGSSTVLLLLLLLLLIATHHRQRQVSLGIFDGVVDQLGVFRHDGGLGNEGRIGGGVLWLDLSDRVDVAGIGNDDGVFEELVVFRGHGCSSSSTSCCFCLLLVDCLFVVDVAGDGCCLGVLVLLLTGFVCVFLLY